MLYTSGIDLLIGVLAGVVMVGVCYIRNIQDGLYNIMDCPSLRRWLLIIALVELWTRKERNIQRGRMTVITCWPICYIEFPARPEYHALFLFLDTNKYIAYPLSLSL